MEDSKTPYRDTTRIIIKMNQIVPTDNENSTNVTTEKMKTAT